MKRAVIFLVTLSIPLCIGCERAVKFFYNIEDPTPKSTSEIREYAEDREIVRVGEDMLVLRDSVCFQEWSDKELLPSHKLQFPNVQLLDSLGRPLFNSKEPDACIKRLISFSNSPEEYPLVPQNDKNYLLGLEDCLAIVQADGTLKPAGPFHSSDFYIISYWASFAGDKSDEISELLEEWKEMDINENVSLVIFNADILESWKHQGSLSK